MDDNRRTNIKVVFITIQVVLVFVFLIFFGRLIQLQVLNYDKYTPISERNSIRQEVVNPARGLIIDRNGNLLVSNEPSFTITITPMDFNMESIPLLANITGLEIDEVEERVMTARRYSRFRTSRLFTDVSFEVFSNIQENIWQLPGIGHEVEGKRSYPSGARLAHAMGYLAEVTREELQNSDRYRLGDRIGRSGLERSYEPFLRGQSGNRLITVDARGQALGPFDGGFQDLNPERGTDVFTTIDADLQKLAEKLLVGKSGGVVALDPNTGGILAIASAPDFEIERLSGRLDRSYWADVNSNPDRPLFNRSVSSVQPPGSTLKPIMGLIGLETGIITPETRVYCSGGYQRGRFYRCLRVHGHQTVAQAIETSCNTFFYALIDQLVNRFGLNKWAEMLRSFGIGEMNGIDIPGENRGLVPDSSWYDRNFGVRRWGLGDLISLGIGQGAMGSSPLQMAVSTAALVNGGYRVEPHIVSSLRYEDGSTEFFPRERQRIPWFNRDHLASIHTGMRRSITETNSGNYFANVRDVEIAGKTGTAQNPHGQNHGWFISYAPADDPQVVIAVLLEGAGYGSVSAAPLASLMFEQYFLGEIRRNHILDHVLNFTPAPFNPN